MKSLKNLFAGLTVALTLAASGVAQASFIATDTFSYGNQAGVTGLAGGSGWGANTWQSSGGAPSIVNGTLHLSGNNNAIAYRQLGSAVSAATTPQVFVSVSLTAIAPSNIASLTNVFAGIWLDSVVGTGDHNSNVPNFGLKTEANTGNDLFARLTGGGGPWASNTNVVVGQTYQLVLGLTATNVGGVMKYTGLQLWINPSSLASAPSISITSGNGITGFSYVGIRTANLGSTAVVQLDNLIVANAFNDVLVPEPTSLALLGMAGVAGLGRVIRRRK